MIAPDMSYLVSDNGAAGVCRWQLATVDFYPNISTTIGWRCHQTPLLSKQRIRDENIISLG
jgi:hypothetical protein